MEFRVHWLSVTIWCSTEHGLQTWKIWFEDYLGKMQPLVHGGRGFRNLYKALVGAKLYTGAISTVENGEPYIHLELPGSACDALPSQLIKEFVSTISIYEKCRFSRLDLAWDGVGFTPETVKNAVEKKMIRSHLKRRTMNFSVEPLEKKEDGSLGTSSIRLGSGSSQRLLRVYDKRGPVRLELQLRGKRADKVANDVLVALPKKWPNLAIGHLRDYVDFADNGTLLPWWREFVKSNPRTHIQVTDAREKELERLTKWLMQQVSPTYSAVVEVVGPGMIDAMIEYGKKHRGHRFDSILQVLKKGEHGKTIEK